MRFFFFFLLIISLSYANQNLSPRDKRMLNLYSKYDSIFKKYEEIYGIPHVLMKAIAIKENAKFDIKSVGYNTNGTKDIGLMQINTNWIKWMPEENITIEKLKEPDFNIRIAYIIVSDILKKNNYSWESIGMYHSRTKKYKSVWIEGVKDSIKYLAQIDDRIVIERNHK